MSKTDKTSPSPSSNPRDDAIKALDDKNNPVTPGSGAFKDWKKPELDALQAIDKSIRDTLIEMNTDGKSVKKINAADLTPIPNFLTALKALNANSPNLNDDIQKALDIAKGVTPDVIRTAVTASGLDPAVKTKVDAKIPK